LFDYLPQIGLLALLNALVIALVIPWVIMRKREPTVAVAWCLVVVFMPLLGALLFWVFGYNVLHRRIRHKQTHQALFETDHPPHRVEARRGAETGTGSRPQRTQLARLAQAVQAFPVSPGNTLTSYSDTQQAFTALLDQIAAARHHVHLQFFILRSDATGRLLIELLAERARSGVEVRLLYDSVGSLFFNGKLLRPLREAGGRVGEFLPVNPLRSWIQVNLRNHRKITIVDGRVGFLGGMNVGDEYLGRSRYFGYWRDAFFRLEGPATAGLQRIFTEDWDFATGEAINGAAYFPEVSGAGLDTVQVLESGPDQTVNSARELYFGAILSARHRLWIASPYFVPDSGILDALRLARYRGVDVRLLCLQKPDHWLAFYASRFYWADMLATGASVYQYARGMMHSKLLLIDGRWAVVGSANLDNRSLHLNFEISCIVYTPERVAELEAHFLEDLEYSVPLDPEAYAKRPFLARLTENACRLFSPIL
jgi:cardiolipin synthase